MTKVLIPALIGVTALAGCASSGANAPVIVDGPQDAAFQADLAECQALARQNPVIDGNQGTDAAVLAGIGAIIGSLDGGPRGAATGAAIGGGIGAGGAALDSQKERTAIVRRCLSGRGHRVIG